MLENIKLIAQRIKELREISEISVEEAAKELYYNIAPQLKNRKGGYLRIIKSPRRRKRDGASLAIVEFVFDN